MRQRTPFPLASCAKGSRHTTFVPQLAELPNIYPCQRVRSKAWSFSNGARDFHQRGEENFSLGIAGEGQLAYSLCLSTRQVAEHFSLLA